MSLGESLFLLVVTFAWIMGTAVAKGVWLVAGCVFLPPMAWVIFAQWVLERMQ